MVRTEQLSLLGAGLYDERAMTRSRIYRIKYYYGVSLVIFLLARCAVSDGSFREATATETILVEKIGNAEGSVKKSSAVNPSDVVPVIVEDKHRDSAVPKPNTILTNEANKTVEDVTSKSTADSNRTTLRKERLGDSLNPGALLRGIYVFVGLSVLVMAYIVFRSFRLSKTRAQMVRKYGVLAHRQDVEMRPLPLEEEDDEDTTVFDASNVVSNNVQHQNL